MNSEITPDERLAAMRGDINSALILAQYKPTWHAAHELRVRLRGYVAELLEPAREHVATMPDDRARDIAEQTLRHSRSLLDDHDGDPAARLRLLAKAVECLLRYSGEGSPSWRSVTSR